MKIGLLSFHCAHNYGAVLQAYALQEFLTSLGHDAEFIDYRPYYLYSSYSVNTTNKSFLNRLIQSPLNSMRRLRNDRFNNFIRNNLAISKEANTAQEITGDYEAYVLGSDQIWNQNITKGDLVFFGAFNRSAGSRLISYAASSEAPHEGATLDFSSEQKNLKEFSSISVREDQLREQIQPLVDVPVTTVLDPTLLADASIFEPIAENIESKDYLVIYQVKNDKSAMPVARAIRKMNSIGKIVKLTPHVSKFDFLNSYSTSSPERFVGLFRGCNYVVTTSFHGVIFSIIFKKQFVCIMDKSRGNYRIANLLKKLGISNRMIYSADEIPSEAIDYDLVTEKVIELRGQSREFLVSALAS